MLFRQKPIVAPWEILERSILQLGMLGKHGAIKEYVLLLSPKLHGGVEIHWRMAGRRWFRDKQQVCAVRGPKGPQCPHCTMTQLFIALATAVGVERAKMAELTRHYYGPILKRGSTPTYTLEYQGSSWEVDCRASRGDAHTKYDCPAHTAG